MKHLLAVLLLVSTTAFAQLTPNQCVIGGRMLYQQMQVMTMPEIVKDFTTKIEQEEDQYVPGFKNMLIRWSRIAEKLSPDEAGRTFIVECMENKGKPEDMFKEL